MYAFGVPYDGGAHNCIGIYDIEKSLIHVGTVNIPQEGDVTFVANRTHHYANSGGSAPFVDEKAGKLNDKKFKNALEVLEEINK